MIRFLVRHPVSVIMSFLLCFILGVAAYFFLPVSLLPDIAIPEITVRIDSPGHSAREIEDAAVSPLRNRLLQVGGLSDIRSVSRDDHAFIRLRMNYGVDTDLALIEVNEKVDAAMGALGNRIKRPVVLKENASDIPVFYLNISLRDDADEEVGFQQLSEFVEEVVRHRLEQLPEVAMTDMTGTVSRELRIIPDRPKLLSLGFTLSDIEGAIRGGNFSAAQMQIEDRQLVFRVNLNNKLGSIDDIRTLYVHHGDRFVPLHMLADIREEVAQPRGYSIIDGRRAISLAVIKQSDASMQSLRKAVSVLTGELQAEHPDMVFDINRDQTELLDYTISNLSGSLLIGFFLVCAVTLLFMGDFRSSTVIGINMFVALVCSLFFLYLFGRTLNIISLSGLIMALGLMIDNSIVVTDTITYYRRTGLPTEDACVKGTKEVITPLLSSGLTTIAIFLPLVFLSGVAGVLFLDEAIAVSIGLFTSYITAIILLPVNYKLFYPLGYRDREETLLYRITTASNTGLNRFYDSGHSFFQRHSTIPLILFVVAIPLCAGLFLLIKKKQMPALPHTETTATIDWGEPVSAQLNRQRSEELLGRMQPFLRQGAAYAGEQQFLFNGSQDIADTETVLHLKAEDEKGIEQAGAELRKHIGGKYPKAQLEITPAASIFDHIFDTREPELLARLYPASKEELTVEKVQQLTRSICSATKESAAPIRITDQIDLSIDMRLLHLYGIDMSSVKQALQTAFHQNEIIELTASKQHLPVILTDKSQSIEDILRMTFVQGFSPDKTSESSIPLASLMTVHRSKGLKEIAGGKGGEYLPLAYEIPNAPEKIMQQTRDIIDKEKGWHVDFAGSFFSNRQMIRELSFVLLLSLLLMYFILAAQFESLLQPVIVLMEIPIDIALTLLVLIFTGNTLNLMSAIGIVVACGIIVNDSVLKLDMINNLRRQGMPLKEAIHTAGVRRLRSIVMTSLTTIIALVPTLFASDFGSSLQKPLVIALISAMFFGTLVSLFVIPHIYAFIYSKRSHEISEER